MRSKRVTRFACPLFAVAILAAAGCDGSGGSSEDINRDTDTMDNATCMASLVPACRFGASQACSSYQTSGITNMVPAAELQFGPYGAVMERNVGKDFAVSASLLESMCSTVASSFGEPEETTRELMDVGDLDFTLYTVYRPACMKAGETYPVITWGNGTCAQPEGYGALLRYIASHGYVVFAPNSRYTGTNSPMTKALDFAAAVNEYSGSPLYKRLDMTRIGAMGHSQGGYATVQAAKDSRVDAVIIWNATDSATKPFLAVTGEHDIQDVPPATLTKNVNAATQPGAWVYMHNVPVTGNASGHLTLMTQPHRVADFARAWFDWKLKGDAQSKGYFVGSDCKLCNQKSNLEYGHNALLK